MTLIGRTQTPVRAGRWLQPTMGDIAATTTAWPAVGRVFVAQIQVQVPTLADAVCYAVGATATGNVIASLIQAASLTGDTIVGGTVIAESAPTAQGTINEAQAVAFAAPAWMVPGTAYYVAIQGSSTSGTYMRVGNQRQAIGIAGYFDNAGGFGPVTVPASWTDTGSSIPGMLLRAAT